ncbi:hypothetical protein N9O57_00915 [bacterium]|nr:hypothetical protein [bacterium]
MKIILFIAFISFSAFADNINWSCESHDSRYLVVINGAADQDMISIEVSSEASTGEMKSIFKSEIENVIDDYNFSGTDNYTTNGGIFPYGYSLSINESTLKGTFFAHGAINMHLPLLGCTSGI